MDRIARDLDRFQTILDSETEAEHEEELDQLYLSFRQPDFNQGHLIIFLDIVRHYSWDIPSALGTLCYDPDIYALIPMHSLSWAVDPSNEKYPGLADFFNRTKEAWDRIIPHFKDHHNLDLTDTRINWSFDT